MPAMTDGTIYLVDLDGTLSIEQPEGEEWWRPGGADPEPDLAAIAKVNALRGVKIIHTARRASTDIPRTLSWLKRHGVHYHDIEYDKMRGDYYIDNRALTIKDLP